MNILAVNTTNILSEVVVKTNTDIAREKLSNAFSEHIMNCIINTLNQLKIDINQIDCFGVVTGPGSFTGIRIGLAVIKALAYVVPCKLVSVNSFELLAYNISEPNFITVLNSGNSEHYFAVFEDGKLVDYGFSNLDNIINFSNQKNYNVYCLETEKDYFDNRVIAIKTKENTLVNLIAKKLNEGNNCSINDLLPLYIKVSQAEIGLKDKVHKNLKIRKATFEDVNFLEIIENQCFSENVFSNKTFCEELALEDRTYIIADYNGLAIGYIGLWQTGDELNLLKLAVLPQYRRLGIAKKLIEESKKIFKDKNLNGYFLEVRKSNLVAKKFYEKMGFVTKYEREKYYQNGESCVVMFLE